MSKYVFQNHGGPFYSWRNGPPASVRAAENRAMGDFVFRPGAPEVLTGSDFSLEVPVAAIGIVAAAWLAWKVLKS